MPCPEWRTGERGEARCPLSRRIPFRAVEEQICRRYSRSCFRQAEPSPAFELMLLPYDSSFHKIPLPRKGTALHMRLFRIQLNDELFVRVERNIRPFGNVEECPCHRSFVKAEPWKHRAV